ncbi:MAG: trypsin-like peptidase domain-containing protein [Anaerolineae bacterium]|nr:trypsin-like peptidase domain-containing protein [Anaerolineae bacterium]
MSRKWLFPGLALFIILLVAACTVPELRERPGAAAEPPTPVVVVVVATPTPAPLPTITDSVEAQRIAVYERVAPAVVNITTQVLRSSFFYGVIPEEGSGSGFLWDAEGHIVTNHHVIAGAQKIEVSFSDDFTVAATVVGSDPVNDLAVLKVDSVPAGVTPVRPGESASLKVGQTAIVLGNPFGRFERTMTVGVVSALNRTIETESTVLRGVIQTDAAINRGNSGGPLLDLQGRLIGVNTAIYSPTGTSAGVGLAIPVDKVRRVVPVLIREGRYPHPWLGVEGLGYEITPALAKALRLPVERGLLVARLYRNSPADQAGLRTAQREVIVGNRRYLVGGDIITEVDGRPMATWDKLSAYLDEECEVGQTITLTVVRDGTTMTLKATLQDTPESLRSG